MSKLILAVIIGIFTATTLISCGGDGGKEYSAQDASSESQHKLDFFFRSVRDRANDGFRDAIFIEPKEVALIQSNQKYISSLGYTLAFNEYGCIASW